MASRWDAVGTAEIFFYRHGVPPGRKNRRIVQILSPLPDPPIDVEKCPKLKTFICYGTPEKSILAGLRKAKSLERLIIYPGDDGILFRSKDFENNRNAIVGGKVNFTMIDERMLNKRKEIERMLKALNGVEVTIVPPNEPFEPPPAFQEHAVKTKAAIREKYLSK